MSITISCGVCDRDITCPSCGGIGTYYLSANGSRLPDSREDEAAWQVQCKECYGRGTYMSHWCEPDEG